MPKDGYAPGVGARRRMGPPRAPGAMSGVSLRDPGSAAPKDAGIELTACVDAEQSLSTRAAPFVRNVLEFVASPADAKKNLPRDRHETLRAAPWTRTRLPQPARPRAEHFLDRVRIQDRLEHVFDRESVAPTLFRRLDGEPNSARHGEPLDPDEDVDARHLTSGPGRACSKTSGALGVRAQLRAGVPAPRRRKPDGGCPVFSATCVSSCRPQPGQ